MVAIDAGRLPAPSRVTIRQFTFPRALCAVTPKIFVNDANTKSVPTAISMGILKRKTNVGVIRDPPPTPVSPTTNPTTNPTRGYKDCNGTQFPKTHLSAYSADLKAVSVVKYVYRLT